jgi:coenzyme F420-reducing hydrogenase delta subunit
MNTEAMVKNKELTEYLKDNLTQKENIEDEMLELGDRLTDLMLERERLDMEYHSMQELKDAGEEYEETRYLEIE